MPRPWALQKSGFKREFEEMAPGEFECLSPSPEQKKRPNDLGGPTKRKRSRPLESEIFGAKHKARVHFIIW